MNPSQMLIVAGGTIIPPGGNYGAVSTEVLDYTSRESWRFVGPMPRGRRGTRGVTIGGVFYVSAGWEGGNLNAIVSYNPESESWQEAGSLTKGRHWHGGAAVPLHALKDHCPGLVYNPTTITSKL